MRAIAGVAASLVVLAAALAAAPTRSIATGTPPSVTTGSTASVTATSAQVNGTVNPNGSATTYVFQYGATTAYGSQTGSATAGSGAGAVTASATISGLVADTTYHYRLVASSDAGTIDGLDMTFTTAKAPPVVATGSATSVTSNSAVLGATVNPEGKATNYQFQYGASSAYGLQTPAVSAGSGTSALAVKTSVSGLTPGTTYHFRVIATNPDGTGTGTDSSFATVARAPVVSTAAPAVVTSASATIAGAVNPNGKATTYAFQYGPTTAYGSQTAYATAGSGTSSTRFSAMISGLAAGTAYHYRIVATNSAGATTGADAGFVTTAAAAPSGAELPLVSQAAAAAISTTGAQLNGAINPSASRTTWHFDYGLTTSYGVQTAPQTMSGLGARPVNVRLAGLAPGTTFHFRLVAVSGSTQYDGPDTVFTTKRVVRLRPAGLTLTASSITRPRSTLVTVSGVLRVPAALAAQSACNGAVQIQVMRGADTIWLRSVALGADCTFSRQVAVARGRLRGAKRLGIVGQFTGNAVMLPTANRRTSIHA